MQTYEILVRERSIQGNSPDMTLVRTSVGIDQVHVLFDNAEWLEFPITITFAQGDDVITQSLVVSELFDSDEWVAEATATVPYEVIDMVGQIRVTLQGTDSDGRHIITAKGSPLSVEEAGDVNEGTVPGDAPTIDQWHQAYADAVLAASDARAVVSSFEQRITSIQDSFTQAIDSISNIDQTLSDLDVDVPVATTISAGVVQIGDGLDVTVDGVLSASGMTQSQRLLLSNVSTIIGKALDATYDVDGTINENSIVIVPAILPVAMDGSPGIVSPDGTSVTADENGVLSSHVSVQNATVSDVGLVKPDGVTITISGDGTLTASGSGPGGYILPHASTDQLGGVKVDGDTIVIDDNGVLSVAYEYADEMGF